MELKRSLDQINRKIQAIFEEIEDDDLQDLLFYGTLLILVLSAGVASYCVWIHSEDQYDDDNSDQNTPSMSKKRQ